MMGLVMGHDPITCNGMGRARPKNRSVNLSHVCVGLEFCICRMQCRGSPRKIVVMMKSQKLFASQGARPIILSQAIANSVVLY